MAVGALFNAPLLRHYCKLGLPLLRKLRGLSRCPKETKFATLSGSSEEPLLFSPTVRREFPNLAHSKENF